MLHTPDPGRRPLRPDLGQNQSAATYDGTKKEADGAAAIIVEKNLSEAYAANDVASVVFDFRGYDTLGESFILLTAIAGSFVILAKSHHGKEEDDHEV